MHERLRETKVPTNIYGLEGLVTVREEIQYSRQHVACIHGFSAQDVGGALLWASFNETSKRGFGELAGCPAPYSGSLFRESIQGV